MVNHQSSGTWGKRGQGNELLSAVENGITYGLNFIGNIGNYIDDGLSYLAGLLPGGRTAEENLANTRLTRSVPTDTFYYDIDGNLQISPSTLVTPILPSLPAGATPEVIKLHDKLRKLRTNWQVRESQLKKLGLLDRMESTATAAKYREHEKLYKKAIALKSKPVDKVRLTKKQNASFKAEKARATNDLRATNAGRPVMKARQWDYVEEVMRKDPKAASIIHRYDLKVVKGLDPKLLRLYRKKMLTDYINSRKGFDFLKNN